MLAEHAKFAVQERIQMTPSSLANTVSLSVFLAHTITNPKNEDPQTCELKSCLGKRFTGPNRLVKIFATPAGSCCCCLDSIREPG
jgi:hypothetical protein